MCNPNQWILPSKEAYSVVYETEKNWGDNMVTLALLLWTVLWNYLQEIDSVRKLRKWEIRETTLAQPRCYGHSQGCHGTLLSQFVVCFNVGFVLCWIYLWKSAPTWGEETGSDSNKRQKCESFLKKLPRQDSWAQSQWSMVISLFFVTRFLKYFLLNKQGD